MLVCNIKDILQQIKMDPKMEKAVHFLTHENLEKLTPGTIPVDGNQVYVKVMNYSTVPDEELKYEAHKKYIDIHYVISGKEAIMYLDTRKMDTVDEYNPEKDVFHGNPRRKEDVSRVVLSAGDLAIAYPTDAHAPKGMVGQAAMIHKIVIKIACA